MSRISARPVSMGLDGGWHESVPHLREPRFSQSLERGLAILECFSPERPVLRIVDIAGELGMSSRTTHRYLLTLTRLGYLMRTKKKYSLGLPAIDLGMSALNGTSLREHARVHLEDLHRRTGFTVSIAVLDGSEALLVDHLRGRRGKHQINLVRGPESRLPLYCTLGKLLLADLPEHAQRSVLAEMELRSRAGYTVSLGAHDLGELVYVDRWQGFRQGQYAIDVGIGPGTRWPVYGSAAGKALLARLPAAERRNLIAGLCLKRCGPRTITRKTVLRAAGLHVCPRANRPSRDGRAARGSARVWGARPQRPDKHCAALVRGQAGVHVGARCGRGSGHPSSKRKTRPTRH